MTLAKKETAHELETESSFLKQARQQLHSYADAARAQAMQKYFRAYPGEIAEGDLFIGVRIPQIREVVKSYRSLPLEECSRLLFSEIHEERMLATLLLVAKYKSGTEATQEQVYGCYLEHLDRINHWDLVDGSCEFIIGPHLEKGGSELIHQLALAESWWRRRIAIVSTFHLIRKGSFALTLNIAEKLLHDGHDLVQKAVGWMIKEISKRDLAYAESFVDKHHREMGRTMVRCATEKFPPAVKPLIAT